MSKRTAGLQRKRSAVKRPGRRRFIRNVSALGLGAAAAAAHVPAWSQGARAVARGSTFTVSAWGGVTQDAVKTYVQPEFEKMAGVRFAYDIGAQGARYNKLLAQRSNPPADVFFCNDDAVVAGHRAGIFLPSTQKNIPRAADLFDWAVPAKSIVAPGVVPGIAYAVISYVIGYNPQLVKQPPASWGDLWRPEFRGKLALAAPGHTHMPLLLIMTAEMNGGGVQNMDPAFRKMAELRPAKLTFFFTDWAAMARTGDIIVGTEFDYYLQGMKAQGFPIEWVVPKEKGFGTPLCVTIVKGTKIPIDVSEAFLNLMIDPKVQEALAVKTFQGITNRTVKLSADEASKCTCGARLEQARFFDPVITVDNRALWTERLNTEVVPSWGKR
jgi:putative spermidine/putrescine transport system substrate-binding protein